MQHSDTNTRSFAARLATGRPILIDGGLATQCEAMGCNIDGHLWSAQLLQSNPRAIIDASRTYLDAGAEIITTASYQASRRGFLTTGLSADAADALIVSSVALAVQARDEFLHDNPASDRKVLIAASVGPYGATLHDGSEYTGAYDIGAEELREFHRSRLGLLSNTDADLLACETIPSLMEAKVLAELLVTAAQPAWVSFSCRDAEHLSDGTLLADAANLFQGHPNVLALGGNCCPPELVLPIVRLLRSVAPDKAIVVYPNSGEGYSAADNAWSGTTTPLQCAESAQQWLDAGARIVGGCCRIGPAEIAAMRQCDGLAR